MSDTVRFQHFEVLRQEDGSLFELGRGAMGITYKAFDTNLRCFVALKVINGAYLNSEVARQRFLREARAAAALRHPNVATVFHLGSEDDSYFYAMEFVDGETVEGYMKREGAVAPLMALEVALQVSRALIAAEKQGLVHRDIKPSNLMLVRDDESEFTVKVIDFGLAKSSAKEEGAEDSATLTSGGFLGTPHFASPEQLDERPIDIRSDIYSLGVTLWYMLAGKTPFSGSLAQVMSQHLHREPPFENLEGQIPSVVTLLRRMMAKTVEERPQSPLLLRKEIEKCVIEVKATNPAATVKKVEPDESFETAVLPDPLDASRSTLSSGQILAGRFKLIDEITASDHGRMFRAESLEDHKPVAVLILHSEKLSSSQAFTQLEDEVERLQKLPSPALQRILSLERADFQSFLVLEWVEGPTLLDVLRSRRALSLPEACRILTPLGGAFDELQSAELSCPDIAVHEVWLPTAQVNKPVGEWPQCLPKFLPITQAAASSLPVDATMVASQFAMMKAHGAFAGNPPSAFVFAVASLAFEMLGGVKGETSAGAYIPIAGVSEEGNAILRRAMSPSQSYPNAREFVQALSQAKSAPAPAIKPAAAPPSTPRPPAPAPMQVAPPPMPESETLVRAKKSVLPVLAVSGGALLLVVALSVWMMSRQKEKVETPPAHTPVAQTETGPTPAPSATPAPLTPYQTALAEAEALLKKDDFPGAISAFSDLVVNFPNELQPRERLSIAVDGLQVRFDRLTPGEKDALRAPLTKAAELNVTYAQMLLANLLYQNAPDEALKWYIAAAKHNQTEGMVQAGRLLSGGGASRYDLAEAAEWFRQASEAKDPGGMVRYAECLLTGKGVDKDPKQAIELYTIAANLNEPYAQNTLAGLYNKGLPGGVLDPDPSKAFELYSKAANAGFLDAQGNLGVLYINGTGTTKNEKKAVELFRDGAEKNNALCQYLYAMCLEGGVEMAPNPDEAKTYYIKSAKAGNPRAIEWCRKNNVPLTKSP